MSKYDLYCGVQLHTKCKPSGTEVECGFKYEKKFDHNEIGSSSKCAIASRRVLDKTSFMKKSRRIGCFVRQEFPVSINPALFTTITASLNSLKLKQNAPQKFPESKKVKTVFSNK